MADFNITSNLRLELDAANQAVRNWAERQKEDLEASTNKYDQTIEEYQCTLNALKQNESQLEELRSRNDLMKSRQAEEIQTRIQQIDAQKELKLTMKTEIAHIDEDERTAMAKLQTVREEHDKARAKAERSLDDLTHGIKMYMALGLEFQKCDGECMKFIFTNIDAKDPSRKFYFLMYVDSNDKYQLGKGNTKDENVNGNDLDVAPTSPLLDKSVTDKVLHILNKSNDIGTFVVSMRKAFQDLCK